MSSLRIRRLINSCFTRSLQQNAKLPRWRTVLLAFIYVVGILLQLAIAVTFILCEYVLLLLLPFITILISIIPLNNFLPLSMFVRFSLILFYASFGVCFLSYGINGLEWSNKEEGQVILVLVSGILMLCSISLIFIQLIMTYREYRERRVYELIQINK